MTGRFAHQMSHIGPELTFGRIGCCVAVPRKPTFDWRCGKVSATIVVMQG